MCTAGGEGGLTVWSLAKLVDTYSATPHSLSLVPPGMPLVPFGAPFQVRLDCSCFFCRSRCLYEPGLMTLVVVVWSWDGRR